ncbi:MAG: hypothetical protein ACD_48C00541G0003 [uncultured bacterium]|nr:MAG: hypothetical protein ACD_48C00541G0003 [uncultured bacterium]
MIPRTSARVVVTADLLTNSLSVSVARRYASVVFPHPGGPQKIIDGKKLEESIFRITPDFPTRCSCPTTSSRFFGRRISASGRASFIEGIVPPS